jgi:dihydrofolate reductase
MSELSVSTSIFPAGEDPVAVRIVAAIGRRGELGRNNQLLFRLRDDMANFRRITAAKPLLMGRRTWESLPRRPLPGRPNIVATRNSEFLAPGAHVYSSLPPALAAGRAMAARAGVGEVCVIGGADIYAAALPFASHMTLTEVDASCEADVFFPDFDRTQWRETARRPIAAGKDNDYDSVICEFERRSV